MSRQSHWQQVYESKAEDSVSWFQATPETSMQLIEETGIARSSRIIDVGGGASRLVDSLLDAEYEQIGVLDVAAAGLEKARRRLGERANEVQWVVSDVTRYQPEVRWDLWHDRAAFHFLVEESERVEYRQALEGAVALRGHVIIATFGPNGPERCSDLPVMRYDPEALSAQLGDAFTIRKSVIEDHRTPSGAVQEFSYSWFEYTG